VFHRFYHECRVVSDDAALSTARLRLAEATRIVLQSGLALMGVSAPQRMERAAEVAT
jgi:arginyl-tRNA synthetase